MLLSSSGRWHSLLAHMEIGQARVHSGVRDITIGTGSVVVKDVPDNAVVVGNLAKIIKYNKPL